MPDSTTSKKPTDKQILTVVEDETVLLSALVERLESAGYTVAGCTSATEAHQLLHQHHPDLLITDLVMHEMDGLELIRLIRQDTTLANLPIIVLTNVNDPAQQDKATALGVDAYLVKAKHSLEDIAQTVQAVLADDT